MTNPLRYKLYLEDKVLDVLPSTADPKNLNHIRSNKSLVSTLYHTGLKKGANDKLIEEYYFKIRAKGYDQTDTRYTDRIRGMQKELYKRNIKSMLWKWYQYPGDSYHKTYTYTKWSKEDGHFGEKGHKEFSERLLLNILYKDIPYWKNIYERYDKLI